MLRRHVECGRGSFGSKARPQKRAAFGSDVFCRSKLSCDQPLRLSSGVPGGNVAYTKDRISAVVLLALAGAVWWFTQDVPGEASMFPRVVGGLLGFLAVLLFGRTLIPSLRSEDTQKLFENPKNLAKAVIAVILYVVLVTNLGFFTASLLWLPAFALALGENRPKLLSISTIGFLLGVYVVFVLMFERILPEEAILRFFRAD